MTNFVNNMYIYFTTPAPIKPIFEKKWTIFLALLARFQIFLTLAYLIYRRKI
jgi:hypothetical protein